MKSVQMLVCLLFYSTANLAMEDASWDGLFEKHAAIIPPIVSQQYAGWELGAVPCISAPVITEIPIKENNEELVEISSIKPSKRLSMMPDPIYPIQGPGYNSGLPDCAKVRAQVLQNLSTMITYLDKYASHFGYSAGQIDIRVCDGLRHAAIQQFGAQYTKEKLRIQYPDLSQNEFEVLASMHIAPPEACISRSSGGAVDLRLWNNETSEYLDMGKFGTVWGENKEAPTFCIDTSFEQKRNRLLSVIAASEAGLTNYPSAHWSFMSNERYDVYWRETDPTKRISQYGVVANADFDIDVVNGILHIEKKKEI